MNRAPEPTESDIARASIASAREVFDASDGRLTVAYYRRLCAAPPLGPVAMNLFRAQKTSSRAKQYRGRRFREASYDVKNYSLERLVEVLRENESIEWGWKLDETIAGFQWVLYIDLPQIEPEAPKQVSFHSAIRLDGPDYRKEWDGQRDSGKVILAFCDNVLAVKAMRLFMGEKKFGIPSISK